MSYISSHFTIQGDYFFIPPGSSLRKDLNSQTEEKCLCGWRIDWWLNPLISWLGLSKNNIIGRTKGSPPRGPFFFNFKQFLGEQLHFNRLAPNLKLAPRPGSSTKCCLIQNKVLNFCSNKIITPILQVSVLPCQLMNLRNLNFCILIFNNTKF